MGHDSRKYIAANAEDTRNAPYILFVDYTDLATSSITQRQILHFRAPFNLVYYCLQTLAGKVDKIEEKGKTAFRVFDAITVSQEKGTVIIEVKFHFTVMTFLIPAENLCFRNFFAVCSLSGGVVARRRGLEAAKLRSDKIFLPEWSYYYLIVFGRFLIHVLRTVWYSIPSRSRYYAPAKPVVI